MAWPDVVWIRRSLQGILLGVGMSLLGVHAGEKTQTPARKMAPPKWVVVQPAHAHGFQFDMATAVATGLTREWGYPVRIDAATRGKGSDAARWSLEAAPRQPSVLLLPEESMLFGDAAKDLPMHIAHFEPLVVLAFKRWCLFTRADFPLDSAQRLRTWLAKHTVPVRIALPIAAGRMRLWTQGMAYLTQHRWDMQPYGVNGDFARALADGADMAIGRCDRVGARKGDLKVLLQSGDTRAPQAPDIPTFREAGWAPFEHGWSVAFAPKTVDVAERERMAQALYRVAQTPAVREGLRNAGFMPADLPPRESAAHIESFVKAWASVGHFLLGQSFGNLQEMAQPAMPARVLPSPPDF